MAYVRLLLTGLVVSELLSSTKRFLVKADKYICIGCLIAERRSHSGLISIHERARVLCRNPTHHQRLINAYVDSEEGIDRAGGFLFKDWAASLYEKLKAIITMSSGSLWRHSTSFAIF